MEDKNIHLLRTMKEQLAQYAKTLDELSKMLDLSSQEEDDGTSEPNLNREKAQGTAEVKKHWDVTDNDPMD